MNDDAPSTTALAPENSARWAAALDNRWLILGTCMLVLGALGLPALWKSRAFSTPAKFGWSVVIVVETIACWTGLLGLLYVSLAAVARLVFVG